MRTGIVAYLHAVQDLPAECDFVIYLPDVKQHTQVNEEAHLPCTHSAHTRFVMGMRACEHVLCIRLEVAEHVSDLFSLLRVMVTTRAIHNISPSDQSKAMHRSVGLTAGSAQTDQRSVPLGHSTV